MDNTTAHNTTTQGGTPDLSAAIELLREPHVGVLAVATDGAPAAVPLWFDCARDGSEIWLHTGPATRKARWLERGRPATLVVHTETPRMRFASLDLELTGRRPATSEDVRAMAGRYLGGDALDDYLEFAQAHLPDEDRYTFRPTRWRFADLTV